MRSVGIDVGACVVLQLAQLASKSAAVRLKALGFDAPTPLAAALVLESPAIAPASGLAATMLHLTAPPEPFAHVRREFRDVHLPTLVAVGALKSGIDAAQVAVTRPARTPKRPA